MCSLTSVKIITDILNTLKDKGVLYEDNYEGLYCVGCEKFITEGELVDGKCPDHQKAPEEVTEENWFFLLSKDSKWLKKLLTDKNGYTIVPKFRQQETLSLIEQGLEDISFSRPKSSLDWGVPVPDDDNCRPSSFHKKVPSGATFQTKTSQSPALVSTVVIMALPS